MRQTWRRDGNRCSFIQGLFSRSRNAANLMHVNGGFSNWAYGSSSFSFFKSGRLSLIRVTLLFAVWLMSRGTSLHACVGLAVESLALGRASRCAAVIFGFIYYPAGASLCDAAERARTSSGEDDTIRFWFWAVQIMLCPPPSPDGTRCHLPTCGGAERPVCAQQRRQRDVCLSSASGASPRI